MSSFASTAGLRFISSILVKIYFYALQIFIDVTFYITYLGWYCQSLNGDFL